MREYRQEKITDSYGGHFFHVRISSILYYVVLIFTIAYFAVLPLRSTQIRHAIVLGGSVTFYTLSFYRMITAKYQFRALFRTVFLFLLLSVLLIESERVTIENIYNCLNYFALFIILTTDNDVQMTTEMRKWSCRAFLLIAFLLFITSQSSAAYFFEDGKNSGALVLGMTNPNLTAMLIACVIGLLLNYLPDMRYKFVLIPIILGLLYLIWLTGARSSIVAVIIMVAYAFLFKNLKLNNFLIVIPIVASILFVPMYLLFFQYASSGIYRFLGKTIFSGRQFIYQRCLQMLNTPWRLLFGNFDAMQFANAHNAPLTILCTLGITGFLVSYFSFTRQLIRVNKRANTIESRISIVMILCVYLLSAAESLMFTGVFPSIAFMYFYMVLADRLGEANNSERK